MVVTKGREEAAAHPKVQVKIDLHALEETPCEGAEVVEVQRPSTTAVIMTMEVVTTPRKATM
jgi:hypothetical protein